MIKPFNAVLALLMVASGFGARAQTDTLTNEGVQSAQPAVKAPAPRAAAPAKKGGATNVLDFEGEVIEGERRRPDLFLQMSIDNVKFDSLIYQRDDFNDYLEVDRKSRTRYLKLK